MVLSYHVLKHMAFVANEPDPDLNNDIVCQDQAYIMHTRVSWNCEKFYFFARKIYLSFSKCQN
jgi:hypothetical protein